MNNRNIAIKCIIPVILAMCLIFSLVSCGVARLQALASNTQTNSNTSTAAEVDNAKAAALIKDFFSALYSGNIEQYAANMKEGTVNGSIKDFMAKSATEELSGNPDAPFHYPRYININGMTMIQYQLMKSVSKDGKETPYIDLGLVGSEGNKFVYYVKCGLVALCIPTSEFEKTYTLDENGLTYTRTAAVNREMADEITIQISYDVTLVNEDNSLRVAAFTEANTQLGIKNRLFMENNDFVTRLPYLQITNDPLKNIKANPEDVKTYETESAFIQKFFRKLIGIDRARMDTLQNSWEKSQSDFAAFLGRMDLPGAKGDEGELTDTMRIDNSYKQSFDIESFPLVINLQRIAQIKSFNITPHPAYSKNIKRYIVKFIADAEEKNGIPGATTPYSYDYFVTLAGSGDSLKISDIRLNEYYGADIN